MRTCGARPSARSRGFAVSFRDQSSIKHRPYLLKQLSQTDSCTSSTCMFQWPCSFTGISFSPCLISYLRYHTKRIWRSRPHECYCSKKRPPAMAVPMLHKPDTIPAVYNRTGYCVVKTGTRSSGTGTVSHGTLKHSHEQISPHSTCLAVIEWKKEGTSVGSKDSEAVHCTHDNPKTPFKTQPSQRTKSAHNPGGHNAEPAPTLQNVQTAKFPKPKKYPQQLQAHIT